jgi:hypothetical protein
MLNTNRRIKYKTFLHEVARSWTLEVQNPNKFSSDELQWPEKQPTPRGPQQEPPTGRLSLYLSKHRVDRVVAGGDGKKKHLARQNEVLSAHNMCSETRYLCTF